MNRLAAVIIIPLLYLLVIYALITGEMPGRYRAVLYAEQPVLFCAELLFYLAAATIWTVLIVRRR